ncbi:MAG: hypothetical protein ACOX15_02765 [Tepidanaerobacteraceae bacterium]
MSSIIFDIYFFKNVLSIFFTGCVIKIMDDYVDQDYDALIGKYNIVKLMGYGAVLYGLLFFSVACALNVSIAVSLFLASFAIGMVGVLCVKMPSGFFGYIESIAVLIIGIILVGSKAMISAVFVMASIQLLDDYIDLQCDMSSKKNLAFILGKMECIILAIILFLIAFYFEPEKSIIIIVSAPLVTSLFSFLSNKLNDYTKMEEAPDGF